MYLIVSHAFLKGMFDFVFNSIALGVSEIWAPGLPSETMWDEGQPLLSSLCNGHDNSTCLLSHRESYGSLSIEGPSAVPGE